MIPWVWVSCTDYLCGHARAVPLAPWMIRWGVTDPGETMALMRRRFRCSACDKPGAVTTAADIDHHTRLTEPFPAQPVRIGGRRRDGESCHDRAIRIQREYLARWPSGDAIIAPETSRPQRTS